jgi:PadR family transcriptional regulator PadR
VRSLLPPLLLLLIYERPGHGYDLIDRLSRLGIAETEPGHVYRVLRNLERQRYVVSVWVTSGAGPARRRYELTEAGEAELEAWMARLTHLDQVVDSCLSRWAHACGTRAPGAARAAQARL